MDDYQKYTLYAAFAVIPPSVGFLVFFATRGEPARTVGLSISAAMLAAGFLLLLAAAVMIVAQAIIERRARDTVKGCAELAAKLRVTQLYCRRADATQDIENALLEQAKKRRGRIVMCGVCLRDFFQDAYNHRFAGEFVQLLSSETTDVQVVAALLDPDCPEARRRAQIERRQWTIEDIRRTLDVFESQLWTKDRRAAVALYQLRPPIFAVLTENEAFVQRYVGAPPRQPELWRPGECYGDFAPLIRYDRESQDYAVVEAELLDMMASDCTWPHGNAPAWLEPYSRHGRAASGRGRWWQRLWRARAHAPFGNQ